MRKPQAHHDFPKALRGDFEELGFDIDDAKYGRWVEGGPYGDHQKLAKRFNDEWEDFFLSDRTEAEVLEHFKKMREKYH